MSSIISTKPVLCDFCETYNPCEAVNCGQCGEEIETEFGYAGFLSKPKTYLMVSLALFSIAAFEFITLYPPGRIIKTRYNTYYSTETDIFIWVVIPAVLGVFFVAVSLLVKLKNKAVGKL